jgi:ubiquinone/menaquinone biosynthesis C-methylase UbiE
VTYSAINTIAELDVIERDRDRWQRPEEILSALDVRPGSTVVDLGSGAGYFSLKLARIVGDNGRVQAIDLRKLSLFFLKARALPRGYRNIQVIKGSAKTLPVESNDADAVLICNTYHELVDRNAILKDVYRTLRQGGRLVIVDRDLTPRSADGHGIAFAQASMDLEEAGFRIMSTNSSLLTSPDGDIWWLIAATKP